MKKIIAGSLIVILFLVTACSFFFDLEKSFSITGKLSAKLNFIDYDTFLDAKEKITDDDLEIVDIKSEMEVSEVNSLILDISFGDISIVEVDEKTISIHYFSIIETSEMSKEPELDFDEGKEFSFEADWAGFTGKANAVLLVSIPKEYKGSIKITSISGDIKLGNFKLEELNIDSISGDILSEEIEAEVVNIESVSGEIFFDKIISEDIQIESIAGNISFTIDDHIGDISVSNVSGDVLLNIKGVINTDFDIDTTSGEIRCEYNFDDIQIKDEDILKGKVGKGQYDLMIESIAGDIEIK